MKWVTGTIALLALAGALAAGALARVATPDRTPPTVAGLESATTCIPGPIGGQTTSYRLSWDPATDDVTPSRKIVYDIYQTTKRRHGPTRKRCGAPSGAPQRA